MINPLVSVIIPVYNTAEYITEAINSITCQTLKDIQIIVINDGSTDNSLSFIEDLASRDNRIKVLSQPNQGQSIARNLGFENSTAKYIYFMDSDDLLEPDALQMCYDKCEKNNLDFVFFEAEMLDVNISFNLSPTYQRKDFTDESKLYKGIDILNRELDYNRYSPAPWLNFIRYSYLKDIKLLFYPKIAHEDQLFTALLYLQASKTMCIHRAFFKRRLRPNSVMTSLFSMKDMTGYFTITQELKQFANSNPSTQATVDKLLSQMLNAAVWLSHKLPLKERIFIARRCITKYSSLVSMRNLLLLLFKSFIKK